MSWAGTKWPRLWCWNHWITQQVPKTAFPGPAKLPGRGPRRSFSSKCFFYALSCVVDAKTSANVLHIDLCFFRLVHMRYTVKGQTFCTLFDYQYLSVVNICQWDLEPSWIVDMSRIPWTCQCSCLFAGLPCNPWESWSQSCLMRCQCTELSRECVSKLEKGSADWLLLLLCHWAAVSFAHVAGR